MKTTIFNPGLVYISSLHKRLKGGCDVNQRKLVYISVYISVYMETAVNKGFAAFVNYVN